MPQKKSPRPKQQTIKLSLRWVFISMLIVFGIGILGGLVGQFINPATLPPLTSDSDRLVTTVQQVTISPNSATASTVEKSKRSVVLLAQSNQNSLKTTNTGLILTNDGLIATTTAPDNASYVSIDEQGIATPLDRVGTDALYGISYFRLKDKVIVPLEIRNEEAPVGASLIALGRSVTTISSRVLPYTVQEYVLPSDDQPAALQKIIKTASLPEGVLAGTPLLDEEGKVAGMVTDPEKGLALSSVAIKESLDRIIAGKREQSPFTDLGFTTSYEFSAISLTSKPALQLVVTSVTPNTPAANAGLKTGDTITTINNEALSWDKSIASQLSASLPITLTVAKKDLSRSVTLEKVPVSN